MPPRFDRFRARQFLDPRTAARLNALLGELESLLNVSASGGLGSFRSAGGAVATDDRAEGFWARITGAPIGNSYPWQEVWRQSSTSWADRDDGRSSDTVEAPAEEANGNATPADAIVWLRPQPGSEAFQFDYATGSTGPTGPAGPPGSAGLSLALGEDFDPEPILPFGPPNDASPYFSGVVNCLPQSFAGEKDFRDGISLGITGGGGTVTGSFIEFGGSGNANTLQTDSGDRLTITLGAATVFVIDPKLSGVGGFQFYDVQIGISGTFAPVIQVGTAAGTLAIGFTGTGGAGDTFKSGFCTAAGGGASLTVGSSPVISGTNGSLFIESGGVLQQITPAALDSSEATAIGAIADGTYGG